MIEISDLRERPAFTDILADRIWHAFWQGSGVPLAALAARVRESLGEGPIPFALVAHEGDRFVGTASVIVADEPTRPDLAPWVAAVLVEPADRERGTATRLLAAATRRAFGVGVARLHLGCASARRPFYEARGWRLLEADVPRSGMHVLVMDRPGPGEEP